MPLAKKKTMSPWVVVSGGVLVAGAAVWGVVGAGSAGAGGVVVPTNLTVDALKQRSQEPGRAFGEVRQALGGDELTDEQKRQVAENIRTVRRATMRERMDEYYNADPDEKEAILDKHLDEMQERFKRFRGRGQGGGAGSGMSEEQRKELRQLFRPQSKQDRKSRSESRSADDTARAMVYFTAMRSRATQRGIQMPRGPGGGRSGAAGRRRGP